MVVLPQFSQVFEDADSNSPLTPTHTTPRASEG
jgi:hypothetical protein